ncbi:MAG: HEAT repeat domain-containing protein [Acidobacteria bacterium]|uniref:HEAT repeat domain-containing protein n=1 Tax=Candidatus Polarisedimenticola svalbardensis TaxID=2886004 RepID=A0A8J6Y5W2_9BACT|nr:HEAT repeat domain-containing protein [Candidatus Polarisedimenticola svalbardensis]
MRFPILLLCTLLTITVSPLNAQEASPAEELLAFEKLRDQVESAYSLCTDPPEGVHDRQSGCYEATQLLLAMGPDVIPFVENELTQETAFLEYLALNVLSFMPSEETIRIVKEAIQRFDRGDENARTRMLKLSALHALAVQGDPAAVDLGNSGRIQVGLDRNLFLKTPLMTVLATLTVPESIPRLEKQITLYGDEDRYLDQLLAATTAYSQVAVPESFDTLSRLLKHPEWPVRMAAVDGFRRLGDARSVDRLLEILNKEEDRRIRLESAQCLQRLKPPLAYERILAVLEKEPFYPVRGVLYKTIAQIGGSNAVPALLQHRGSPDPDDRRVLVAALGWTGSTKALPVIRKGLQDRDDRVVFAALEALDRIGTPGAIDSMLSTLNAPGIGPATVALDLLVAREESRAAPRIASRLLSGLLAGDASPQDRDGVRNFSRGLVSLRYAKAHRDISAALQRQTDPVIREILVETATHLRLIETNGSDVDLWAGHFKQDNHATRSLVAANLGSLGTRKAVDRLLAEFKEADLDLKLDIVRHLNRADAGQVAGLLEEIMTSPDYSPGAFGPLRATAAWTAGRIGGEQMIALLQAASEQVQGADWFYLLYLMKAAGKDAIPHLEAVRVPRLRLLDSWRWHENRVLETVADDLRGGVTSPLLDTPPEKLEIQHL